MLRPSIFNDNFTDSLFDDFFSDVDMFAPSRVMRSTNAMNTDIRELDQAYQIDMELPGFSKQDVKAELKDGYMTIEAAHDENNEEKDEQGRFIRRERYSGSFKRSFYVGNDVTQEEIKAKFNDGILTIMIPKVEAKPEVDNKKYIEIEG